MKPIDAKKITCTSKYGKRKSPITGKDSFHYGIDLVGGSDIIATADGKIIKVVDKGSKGGTMCLVRVQHKDYQSAYYHNKSNSATVKVGDYVKKGDKIATIGNTGNCTGTHLHFQIDKGTNNTAIDPYNYVYNGKELIGLTKPIENKYTTGTYEVLSARYVRKGAGTEFSIKKVKELTSDGQRHATSSNKNALAQYKVGTRFSANSIEKAKNGSIWGKTPSGYVCIESSKGTKYCKMVK